MVRPDTDELIAFLNSLVAVDPYMIAELLTIRVPCTTEIAMHPTVQVHGDNGTTFIRPGTYRVGLLGILNGYCGVLDNAGDRTGWGPIAAVYDNGKLIRFERTDFTSPARAS